MKYLVVHEESGSFSTSLFETKEQAIKHVEACYPLYMRVFTINDGKIEQMKVTNKVELLN